nr:uncharacterized protein LOC127339251 [Lolium perenne]
MAPPGCSDCRRRWSAAALGILRGWPLRREAATGAAPSVRRRARPLLSREVVATTFVAYADLRLLPSTGLALSGPDACLNIADSARRMPLVAAAGSFGFGIAREVKPPSPSPWSRGVLI